VKAYTSPGRLAKGEFDAFSSPVLGFLVLWFRATARHQAGW
jgi:hypothetical protein